MPQRLLGADLRRRHVSGNERCDDGDDNGPAPALCSPACQLNSCGNGEIDPGEQCDDGDDGAGAFDNSEDPSCLLTCEWNVCGDGFLLAEVNPGSTNPNDEEEECDDTNTRQHRRMSQYLSLERLR